MDWDIQSDEVIPDFISEMEDIMSNGIAFLECGCEVEPDGVCPCGNMSPLLEMGMI